jgi:uncharacterized membrane protein YdjX (TVP38/TMEM64 family)
MTDIVTQPANTPRSPLARYLPILAVAIGAGLGWWFLRDYLSFSALAENREALIAFRDANYIGTVAVFIAIYALIVAFSLPGATIATLTGGFLFATFPGAFFNITAATSAPRRSSSPRRPASARASPRGSKAAKAW